jgi:pyruvate/2-oxoacid:ferredoxin oxidoreductase alpha subunit
LDPAVLEQRPGSQDFALIAHATALRTHVPVLHFFDGFRTSRRGGEGPAAVR